ncbi:hypothetical protein K437DRAFT_256414 [Tilletiaria anomala UBC 951]|uniref:Uncharacterized protein n=1 Tax=Tilletiaria anomala (strain ATCC 24038 / CBS 436.72 / UBC 951) TaxID=1037660 RepID=A0A066VW23_TILAU|nr:uncharacterized protein K437DRAFT_256414 [Tilletiaria anomala UBC 951]KDN45892.1 hypothetical protein K437DRAFT_256414 [Tilletiaria anomala UBC 951]
MSGLSLPPQTLFRCEGVRLVKHVPSVPARVNGSTPKDSINAYGSTGSRNTALADWRGTLYLDTVQDPFTRDISTLVLSIDRSGKDATQAASYGAARRCVLPFRSYNAQDAINRSEGHKPQALREVFLGLTYPTLGAVHSSFWFYEDASERGAMERAALEGQGAGRRAVWTCFVPGTWQEFTRLKDILEHFPQQSLTKANEPREVAVSHEEQERLSDVRKSLFWDNLMPDASHLDNALPSDRATHSPDGIKAPSSLAAACENAISRSATLRRQLDRSRLSAYRNSLIAVDNGTGEILGVVATDVHLQGNDGLPLTPNSISSEEGAEAITPDREQPEWTPTNIQAPSSILRPASKYSDPDDERVRPPSRARSILKEETFAPPPLPIKMGGNIRDSLSSAAFYTAAESASEADSDWGPGDEDAAPLSVDQFGVGPHRPELLRDLNNVAGDAAYDSDASGSTEGGPAVRLWRKARGKNKKGQKKTHDETVEPTHFADAEKTPRASIIEAATLSVANDSPVPTPEPEPLNHLLSADDKVREGQTLRNPLISSPELSLASSKARRKMLRTDEVRRAEDNVWTEALSSGALPVDAAYTHLHSSPLKPSTDDSQTRISRVFPRSEHATDLHGGTVLLEFLADSRIGATLISGPQASTEVSSGAPAKSVIPMLPMHMLWFLGIANETNVPASQRPTGSFVSVPTLENLKNVALSLPERLATSASTGSAVFLTTSRDLWTGLAGWTLSASSWVVGQLGNTAAPQGPIKPAELEDDGTFEIPKYDPDSWGATPRPVFRRRRPTPSFQNGYDVGPQETASSKYSILHIDGQYHPRDVYFRA